MRKDKEPAKIKDYAVDKIVGGVGGDLVEKSARKIARRIGVVTSIVLTLITAILSTVVTIVTFIAGGKVMIPVIGSTILILLIWVTSSIACKDFDLFFLPPSIFCGSSIMIIGRI